VTRSVRRFATPYQGGERRDPSKSRPIREPKAMQFLARGEVVDRPNHVPRCDATDSALTGKQCAAGGIVRMDRPPRGGG
jgi:hypothetical protein